MRGFFDLATWVYAFATGAVATTWGLVYAAFVPTPLGPNATWLVVTGVLAVAFGLLGPSAVPLAQAALNKVGLTLLRATRDCVFRGAHHEHHHRHH